ncbi:hypothetical protein BGX34_008189 [Mortierella sp. NVP85]|nr:hypothetical protein BGX34_008189 [Mortierella sp. NVP85]
MSLPSGFLIVPRELALSAIGSNDSVAFMEELSKAYPGVSGANGGSQVGNECLIHLVAIREPASVQKRKSYSRAKGFDSIVFEQIVAPAIQDDQQRADCKARLGRGDYLIFKPAPPEEWNPLSIGCSSSGEPPRDPSMPPVMNQVGSQAQVIEVQVPEELLEDNANDEDDDDDAEESSRRIQTLRLTRESPYRPQRTAAGGLQYRMSVMAFADTGAAPLLPTDRTERDFQWGETVKFIMGHPIFLEFVRQEAGRLYRQN